MFLSRKRLSYSFDCRIRFQTAPKMEGLPEADFEDAKGHEFPRGVHHDKVGPANQLLLSYACRMFRGDKHHVTRGVLHHGVALLPVEVLQVPSRSYVLSMMHGLTKFVPPRQMAC